MLKGNSSSINNNQMQWLILGIIKIGRRRKTRVQLYCAKKKGRERDHLKHPLK